MPDFDPNKNRLACTLDFIIFLAVFLMLQMFLFMSCVCIWNSRELIFLGALIPEMYYYTPLNILGICLNIYLFLILMVSAVIAEVLGITYVYYLTQVFTKELTLGRKKYRTTDSLRDARNIRLIYRSFQVLNSNVMWFAGPFILFGHASLMIFPIYGNMLLFKYWHILIPVVRAFILLLTLFVICLWLIVLQLGNYLYSRGDKMLVSWMHSNWGSKQEYRNMIRFRKSCAFVLIRFQSTFVIKRITPFLYVKSVIRGTLRSMLTLSKN